MSLNRRTTFKNTIDRICAATAQPAFNQSTIPLLKEMQKTLAKAHENFENEHLLMVENIDETEAQ